jgi:predicted transcriptional regulator
VYAEVSGLNHGAGFLLFVKDGTLDVLECFIHEDSWPADAALHRLYYVRADRDGMLVETGERDLHWAPNEAARAEQTEIIAGIERGIADAEAGRVKSREQFEADFRARHPE